MYSLFPFPGFHSLPFSAHFSLPDLHPSAFLYLVFTPLAPLLSNISSSAHPLFFLFGLPPPPSQSIINNIMHFSTTLFLRKAVYHITTNIIPRFVVNRSATHVPIYIHNVIDSFPFDYENLVGCSSDRPEAKGGRVSAFFFFPI